MPEGTITVTLRCFSHLRHALGSAALPLALPAGATAADAEARVREMLGPRVGRTPFLVAVNRAYAAPETPLADGDELALLPPMQGG